jgi:hypothetical protein
MQIPTAFNYKDLRRIPINIPPTYEFLYSQGKFSGEFNKKALKPYLEESTASSGNNSGWL